VRLAELVRLLCPWSSGSLSLPVRFHVEGLKSLPLAWAVTWEIRRVHIVDVAVAQVLPYL
jgi:hypothetical protein